MDAFLEAQTRQLSLDELLAVIEEEEAGPVIEPGDVVTHVEFPDFLGKVVSRQDGQVMVKVLRGWRGVTVPTHPVGIRADRLRLEVVR